MIRYWRVFKQASKNSFSYLLSYRGDLFFKMFIGLGWSLTWIGFISVFFLHTSSFQGWEKVDVILLLFTFEFITLGNALASQIEFLDESVRRGSFDNVIVKPIDSQFLATFSRPDITNVVFFVFYQIPMLVLLIRYDVAIHWPMLPLYLFLVACGVAIWIALKSIVCSLSFLAEKIDTLRYLLFSLVELGKYPVSIFPKPLRIFFHTFIPIAFITFVPAEVFLGRVDWTLVVITPILTLSLIVLSRFVWKTTVKRYKSASG